MKARRLLPTLYIIAALFLTGCGGGRGNIFSSHRDMERLRPVQTLGTDRDGDGFRVTVSTGAGTDGGAPLVMSARGAHMETAVARLQDYSPEDELFYAHVRYLLLGPSMTGESLTALLDWVERSPAMRMETPLLLVRGEAARAVADAMGASTDVTERLASLEREELTRGRHIYTLRQTAAALLEQGCALCLSVESRPGEGIVLSSGEAGAGALVPAGYAVLRREGPPLLLTEAESLGAELLTTGVSGARVTAGDCVLDLIRGRAVPEPRKDGEALTGLTLRYTLRAGLLEGSPGTEEAARRALLRQTEVWLGDALARAAASRCDYLGLGDTLGEDWAETLGEIPLTFEGDVEIDQTYDLDREAP